MPKYLDEAGLSHFWNNIKDRIGSASQEQVNAWLTAHPEATTTVQPNTVTDDMLVQRGGVLSAVYSDLTTLTPTATSSGWYLNGTGTCSADSSSMLIKYLVTAGDRLYLRLSADNAGVYQWQNNASVSSVNNPYVVGTPVTSAVDGFVIVPEGATYLMVSQFITNTTNLVQSANSISEAVAVLKKDYDNEFVVPTMRNGSMGNPANPNPIAMSYVQPVNGASAIRVTTDVVLNEGQRYYWMVNYFSSSSGASTIPCLYMFDPYDVTTDNYIEIVNDGSFAGFAVALYAYNQDDTFTPLRVANTGDCLTCHYFYDYEQEARAKEWLQVPALRNGTIANRSQTDAMSMEFVISTRDASSVIFTYDGDLNDGDTLLWHVKTFATQQSIGSGSYVRYIDGDNIRLAGNKYIFNLLESEKFIAVAVVREDRNGNGVMLGSKNGYAKCISLRFLYGENRSRENIVSLNEDVLPAVYASSKYGVNGLGTRNVNKGLSMLVSTDVHRSVSQMESAINYLNAIDSIDCGICLGDMAAVNYIESDGTWYTSLVNGSDKPFYTVIGNHDGGNSASISISGTKAQQFAKWIEPTLDVLGISDLTATYYKVDFADYPVTLIVIDNYDEPDTVASGGDFKVSRDVEAISQTQLDWLASALAAVPIGNHLIIARHSGGCGSYESMTDAVFTQPDKSIVSSTKGYDSDPVIELVEAWRNGSSLNTTFVPASAFVGLLPSLSVDADFSSRGTGTFACYIGGHTHWDVISHDSTYGQLFVTLAATANDNWQNKDSDLPRATGCKAEDCLTVVSLDTANRKVNLVRIGSNITTAMTERIMEALSY